MELAEERKLVKKAQKNKKHFDKLYMHYYQKIRTYVYNKVSNNGLADDLTSEVFEKALESIDSFQWQGISFRAWLYRIARNRVFDYYRSARRRRQAHISEEVKEVIPDKESLEETILHDDREMRLYELIASLDENDQFLLYYRYFDGMRIKEIAEQTGMTEANVATRLHRIRKRLKEIEKNGGKEGIPLGASRFV